MKIKDVRASLHGFSIEIPLLEGRVAGYGRAEQTHFVFCEVETDQGIVGYGLTGHFLAQSVVVALEKHVLPMVKDMDPRDNIELIHKTVWAKLNPRDDRNGLDGAVLPRYRLMGHPGQADRTVDRGAARQCPPGSAALHHVRLPAI